MARRKNDQALVSDQAAPRLDPPGFDPSREAAPLSPQMRAVLGVGGCSICWRTGVCIGPGCPVAPSAMARRTEGERLTAGLTEWWRVHFVTIPDGDFERPDWMRARVLENLLFRRRWLERCGAHSNGRWNYRLTRQGAKIRDALRDSDGSPEGGDACGSVHDSAGRKASPGTGSA